MKTQKKEKDTTKTHAKRGGMPLRTQLKAGGWKKVNQSWE